MADAPTPPEGISAKTIGYVGMVVVSALLVGAAIRHWGQRLPAPVQMIGEWTDPQTYLDPDSGDDPAADNDNADTAEYDDTDTSDPNRSDW